MLAYLGNSHSEMKGEFPFALLMFTLGVLLAAMATAGSYFAQYDYANKKNARGNLFRTVSIGLIAGTYFVFGLGSYTAYLGFI